MSTTTTTEPLDVSPELLRPFFGPVVAVAPYNGSVRLPWAQEIRRRYETARQSLMVQQIIVGVGFSEGLPADQRICQTALAIRGWDPVRWSVANIAGGDWDSKDGRLLDVGGRQVLRLEFHCGTLGVAEAVRVTFVAYGLVAGLGPDELSVQVAL